MLECDECGVIFSVKSYYRNIWCVTTGDKSYGIDTINANSAPIDVPGITHYKLGIIDLLALKIKFIIIIGCDMDSIDSITFEDKFMIILGYDLDIYY